MPAVFVSAFLYVSRSRVSSPWRRASLLGIWISVSRRTSLPSNVLKFYLIVKKNKKKTYLRVCLAAPSESLSLYLQVCGIKISNFGFYWGRTTGIKMLIAQQCRQTSVSLDISLKRGKHLKLRRLPTSAATYGSVRFNGRLMDAFQEGLAN